MATEPSDGRARRGYLILAGIIIAAVLIFNIDAVHDLAGDRMDLVALLPDAAGVRVGTPVRVAGVEAGRVIAIAFLSARDSAQLALTVRLDGRVLPVIRRDSDVRAVRLRMIGQPVVEIRPGTAAAPRVTAGDTLKARHRIDPAVLWARTKTLPRAVDSLLTTARRVGEMARARRPELGRLQDRIDAVLAAGGALAADLEGGSLARVLGPGGALDAIARLQSRLDSLAAETAAAIERYAGGAPGGAGGGGGDDGDRDDDGTADGAAALPQALSDLDARVAALRRDLDGLGARIEASGGMIGRLPRDSALQVAVRGVQAQMDSLRQEAASIALRMLLP